LPVARYFIFVGGTLAVLCSSPAGFCQGLQGCSLISRSPSIERLSGIRSAHKWPEKVILDTGQLTISPPVVMDPPTIQPSIPLPADEPRDQPNPDAMALLKPDTQPAAINHSIQQNQTRRCKDRSVEACGRSSRYTPANSNKETVASLGGLIAVKQARMPCRPGALRRLGPCIEARSIGRN
jgi:hypothetical protein